jgi:lysophospholipase L1-like esterase
MKNGRWKFFLPMVLSLIWSADVFPSPRPGESSRRPSRLQTDDARRIFQTIEEQISLSPESYGLPVVREDAAGRIWTAWEEWADGRSRIGVGFLKDDGVLVRQLTSAPQGSDFSPDLALDAGGSPWAIWASYSDLGYRIRVRDMASQRSWSLQPSPKAAITDPKIVIDGKGTVRVFWNETREKNWRIVFRSLERNGWSPESEVLRESCVPMVSPDVARSGQGSIWLAWSGYDGQDYEIYLSRWSGKGWSAAIQLTRNEENDLFPALGIGQNDLPVVTWMRPSIEGNRVLAARCDGSSFGRETPVSPPVRGLILPRIASIEGETVIIWKSAAGLETGKVTSEPVALLKRTDASTPQPPLVFNPDRDENAYIGFGDSITYGYIDRLPAPELGYPPRLDLILDQNFGPTEMINEGLGGENTLGGVVRIATVLGSHTARYILIMEGTNDVINKPVSIDTSVFNIGEMVRKARAAGAFPTITTIVPRRDWAWPDPQVRARQYYLNDQIRNLQAELHVSFIDMDKLFLDYSPQDGGLLSLLSNDRKHPSEKGYQFMAEKWFEEIRNYPFPPVGVELRGKYRCNDASGDPSKKTLRLPNRPLRTIAGPVGSLLFWKHNPKIFDPARIQGYKIYYLKKDDQGAPYRFFSFVQDASIFMDKGLRVFNGCAYLVLALRDDDVEGPCAGPIDD